MRLVVERNFLLSEVENSLTRKLMKVGPTTINTLKMYMRQVSERVGRAISAEMDALFGLTFDGWLCGTMRFHTVVAVYDAAGEVQERLIGPDIPLVGCTSHRVNLVVVRLLAEYESWLLKFRNS